MENPPARFARLNAKFTLRNGEYKGRQRVGTASEFMLHSYTLGIHDENEWSVNYSTLEARPAFLTTSLLVLQPIPIFRPQVQHSFPKGGFYLLFHDIERATLGRVQDGEKMAVAERGRERER